MIKAEINFKDDNVFIVPLPDYDYPPSSLSRSSTGQQFILVWYDVENRKAIYEEAVLVSFKHLIRG